MTIFSRMNICMWFCVIPLAVISPFSNRCPQNAYLVKCTFSMITELSMRPRLKCNHPQRHQKQTTIKNNKKMDLGKADIETIWNKFSHMKINAVKEDHTCKKPAKESHNPEKGYSIEPSWRQSKTQHSWTHHTTSNWRASHKTKQKKVSKPKNRRKLRHALKPNKKVLPEKKKKKPAGSLERNKPCKLWAGATSRNLSHGISGGCAGKRAKILNSPKSKKMEWAIETKSSWKGKHVRPPPIPTKNN